MNVACSTTVVPRTPSTAAVNGRLANSRGSTAGRSAASSNRTNRMANGMTAIAAMSAGPPSPGAADGHEEGDEDGRQQDEARDVDPRPALPGRATGSASPLAGRTTNPTVIAAKSATGTAMTNSDRQPNAPTSSPPMNGPIAALVDTSMSKRPNAAPATVGRGDRADQRDRGRRDERPAQRLQDPCDGQDRERRRRRRQQRRQPEGHHADEEDRSLAVPVAQGATGQQGDGHRTQVQGDQ